MKIGEDELKGNQVENEKNKRANIFKKKVKTEAQLFPGTSRNKMKKNGKVATHGDQLATKEYLRMARFSKKITAAKRSRHQTKAQRNSRGDAVPWRSF
jgi:hypothetical protein